MKTYRVFVGLGSNLGERQLFLNRAVSDLQKVAGVRLVWTSSVYETDPWGKTDQPRFLNAVAEIETTLSPRELFDELKGIESQLGRTPAEKWEPRIIDLDILIYDGLVSRDPHVSVPHPELESRKFVLVPLREIAPDLIHPVNGLTVTEMAAACRDSGRVVKTSHRIPL
jgi:2-amino-4-hydroxy-6-hydroxymethyldihydropteridine diphosphokinase